MSDPSKPSGGPSLPPAPSVVKPPRRSFLSRVLGFIGWLFTLALSVGLAIAALAAIAYFAFGFTLQTPSQIRSTAGELEGLRNQLATAEAQLGTLEGQLGEQGSQSSTSQERLDDVERQLAGLSETVGEIDLALTEVALQAGDVAELGEELEQAIDLAATLQAGARDDQVQIQVFATIQAQSGARLDDLQQRTERLTRFLERLGDIVGDAQSDLSATAIPTAPSLNTATATPATEPTATVTP